jgi:hypothetical protein
MTAKPASDATHLPKPIEAAARKTHKVHRDLEVAGAELELTNTALDRNLPPPVKNGDVARALEQNAVIEDKVQEAAQELAEVKELLQEEVVQRARLERELARKDEALSTARS